MAKGEVEIWKLLGEHQNIVRYLASSLIRKDASSEMLILNEICEGGTLISIIERSKHKLGEAKILAVMRDITQGLKHMHS